jgi:putative signal transducing protein
MRKVFSSIELSETVLIRDALLHGGVAATIQNEFSGRTAVPEFRPPAEVWVSHDGDYETARRIVTDAIAKIDSKSDAAPWTCPSCREENPQSFDICWSCGHDKAGS